jgi:hypothetical protein
MRPTLFGLRRKLIGLTFKKDLTSYVVKNDDPWELAECCPAEG